MPKFVRLTKRTALDIFREGISPRAFAALNTLANNIVRDARRFHEFKNRTGALEDSISWVPPVERNGVISTTVFAGGWARAKFSWNQSNQFYRSHRTVNQYARFATTRKQVDEAFMRRNYRYQRGQRFRVTRGLGIFVNYARFVENKGFSVLKKSVQRNVASGRRLLGNNLKLRAA